MSLSDCSNCWNVPCSCNYIEEDEGSIVYQFREIGESDWTNCSYEWYLYCKESPILDTRYFRIN